MLPAMLGIYGLKLLEDVVKVVFHSNVRCAPTGAVEGMLK